MQDPVTEVLHSGPGSDFLVTQWMIPVMPQLATMTCVLQIDGGDLWILLSRGIKVTALTSQMC